jgi:threonine/homoserine/homoserine lactone efflux protein
MSLETTAVFAFAFFLLALVPGAGLAAILSRTLGSGVHAGLAVTTGLVVGDFIFLGVAMAGLSAIAAAMGPLFQVVKYAGAAYLIWLGYRAFRAASKPIEIQVRRGTALWRDVGIGLLVTLGNPKPILFYGALLPTLLDVRSIGWSDYLIMSGVVVGISYVVYGGYMLLLERTRRFLTSARATRRLNQATGTMLVGSGILVATR